MDQFSRFNSEINHEDKLIGNAELEEIELEDKSSRNEEDGKEWNGKAPKKEKSSLDKKLGRNHMVDGIVQSGLNLCGFIWCIIGVAGPILLLTLLSYQTIYFYGFAVLAIAIGFGIINLYYSGVVLLRGVFSCRLCIILNLFVAVSIIALSFGIGTGIGMTYSLMIFQGNLNTTSNAN